MYRCKHSELTLKGLLIDLPSTTSILIEVALKLRYSGVAELPIHGATHVQQTVRRHPMISGAVLVADIDKWLINLWVPQELPDSAK